MSQPSRNWDGTPETEFDTRFHDLRDSGYTGPIDQDGYAVTSGEDARILRDMAAARGEDTSWWTGDERPSQGYHGGYDHGHRSRPWVVLTGLVLLALVLVVITHISYLRS